MCIHNQCFKQNVQRKPQFVQLKNYSVFHRHGLIMRHNDVL